MGERVGGLLALAAVVGIGGGAALIARAVWVRLERALGRRRRTGASTHVVPHEPVGIGRKTARPSREAAPPAWHPGAADLRAAETRVIRDALAEAILAHHQQLAAALRGDALECQAAGRRAAGWALEALRARREAGGEAARR